MTTSLTVVSGSDLVFSLLGDFARGLGCAVELMSPEERAIRISMPEDGDVLIELLTHVALSATRAGVELTEPLCYLTYRHARVPSEVRLGLRIAEFAIDHPPAAAV